jgi:hypothetical protein
VHTDQFHFTKLQTARQAKNEGPQEFADRCRGLAQKVMCKVNDPVAQRIHRENAERMCLASFVAGLTGVPGSQVRFANPQSMQQALAIALSVTKPKSERTSEIFFTRNDKPSGHTTRRNLRTRARGEQLTHARVVSRIDIRVARPGSLRKARARGAMNVTVAGILRENAPLG